MRLTRTYRLLHKPEFDKVFKQAGQRLRHGSLRALVCANSQGHPRLGLVIAKRFAARAVDRNRFKRQIRESFREHATRLPACDIIVQLAAKPAQTDLRGPLCQIWDDLRENDLPANRVRENDAETSG